MPLQVPKSKLSKANKLESFCCDLDHLLSNINDQHLDRSIVIGDLNAKYSNQWATDKNKKPGTELDSIITKAGYN